MSSAAALQDYVVGDYQLKQVLGEGIASAVFLGECAQSPQELVAVKVLLPAPSLSIEETIEYRKRFVREIATIRERLQHPSILPVLASGGEPSPYFVVPYISGGSLRDRLTQGGLPLHKISDYVMQIAAALDCAHSQQIIHGDLRPENVLVDDEDRVYLADFVIARLFDDALVRISRSGQIVGIPEYLAPEQALGKPVSSATDIYGLAVLVYTLITGQLPFSPVSKDLMLLKVATVSPIPPRTFCPDLPEAVDTILLRALSKDPAGRFSTAGEFAQVLAVEIKGQDSHFQGGASLQENSSLEEEQKDQSNSQGQDTATRVALLSETAASSTVDNENTQKIPVVLPANALNQMPSASKKRSLVSRRAALAGLISLAGIGSGVLWYLLKVPSSSPRKSTTASGSSMSERVGKPTKHSAPTPTVQPTQTPVPTSTPLPPLSVAITSIPSQVMRGGTVPVVVTASQVGISVTLHVTYGNAGAIDSSPQMTNVDGQTTFSWSVSVPPRIHHSVDATVGVTASDAQGQSVQSPLVQVLVMP